MRGIADHPSFRTRLSGLGIACAWSVFSIGSAAAQGVGCDAMAMQPLTLRAFRQHVDAFAKLQSKPAAASALLVCLQRGNRELAETLMLFQHRLRAPSRDGAVVERAFLHYVINSNEPRLAADDTADLGRLARSSDGDIRRVRSDWSAGEVHNGFKTALDAVWPQIIAKLEPPAVQQKEIWLTGHSLGAALAQLAALRLTQAGYRVHRVYTFGTPRIGDKDFVDDYDRRLEAQSFPHVNARDVVARVPPGALGFHAAASAKTRQFAESGHELKITGGVSEAADATGNWRSLVMRSIDKTTAFLPSALRPMALRSMPPPASPTVNLYSARFQRGPLDDHGSFEYLFKLVCASIEYDLWPIELRRSAEGSSGPRTDR